MPALRTLALAARSSFEDTVEKNHRDFNRTGAIMGGCFAAGVVIVLSLTIWGCWFSRKAQLRKQKIVEEVRVRQYGVAAPPANSSYGYNGGSDAALAPPPVYTVISSTPAPLFRSGTTNATSMDSSSNVNGGMMSSSNFGSRSD
ncbi:hypothetical protein DM02DRAFT_78262 [Periconia macrospinosa]|uniref:Uncharacterized protein n=1 Tax=Periconia macrospinosa TaxID=97972 RepID=A0A2V1DIV8_9PLEO|nr:hypothetical protein DM02DRAFT_78262 [Periconia macrospinosa]